MHANRDQQRLLNPPASEDGVTRHYQFSLFRLLFYYKTNLNSSNGTKRNQVNYNLALARFRLTRILQNNFQVSTSLD
jgi:hypothetical protein